MNLSLETQKFEFRVIPKLIDEMTLKLISRENRRHDLLTNVTLYIYLEQFVDEIPHLDYFIFFPTIVHLNMSYEHSNLI